jgi:hypothetical protein
MGFNKKRVGNLFAMVFFVTVMSFGTFLFYKDATIDVNRLDQYSGQIIDKGITTHESSTKFGTRTSDVFFIKLKGLDQILATYNMGQNYDRLNNSLQIGDSVKVYYRASLKSNIANIDTYQIEKDGLVILDNSEYRNKRMTGVYICGIGIIVMIAIGIIRDRKFRRPRGLWYKNTAANNVHVP